MLSWDLAGLPIFREGKKIKIKRGEGEILPCEAVTVNLQLRFMWPEKFWEMRAVYLASSVSRLGLPPRRKSKGNIFLEKSSAILGFSESTK